MNIEEIKEAHTEAGLNFFDKDSMRQFNSQIMPDTFSSSGQYVYFVSSEQYENEPRHYKVRVFNKENSRIWSKSGRFDTLEEAYEQADKLSKE